MIEASADREVTCVRCGTYLYTVGPTQAGYGVKAPRGPDGQRRGTTVPVVLVINDRMLCFCKRTCAARWILATPEHDLRARGMPLF